MIDLEAFKGASVLVIGDVMLDQYWWGSVERISPEAPVPVVRLDRTTTIPGGAANVAANVAAFGGSVSLIGLVGEDEAGKQLRTELEARSIDPSLLCVSSDRRTSVKTRILAHGQQVTRVDIEERSPLTEGEAAELMERIGSALADCDVVVLSDYAKGVLRQDVIDDVIFRAKEANKRVLVDPKGKNYTKYAGASVITPNRKEAADACKLEETSHDLVVTAGRLLVSDLALDAVVITESENGMTLFLRDGDLVHFDAYSQEVFDVTGAGDTVIACLAAGLASGHSLRDACFIANIAGGISVKQIGTATVSLEMLSAELMQTEAAAAEVKRAG